VNARPDVETIAKPPLVEIFEERCEARALLWANYYIELHDAVDELQHWAEKTGLVAAIGQDAVQAILSQPFALVRAELDEIEPTLAELAVEFDAADSWQRLGDAAANCVERMAHSAKVKPKCPADSTIAAFLYVARNESTDYLAKWLAQRPLDAPHLLKIWADPCTGQ
jgi:hypothetical protein